MLQIELLTCKVKVKILKKKEKFSQCGSYKKNEEKYKINSEGLLFNHAEFQEERQNGTGNTERNSG